MTVKDISQKPYLNKIKINLEQTKIIKLFIPSNGKNNEKISISTLIFDSHIF